jgi:hypothetical protein
MAMTMAGGGTAAAEREQRHEDREPVRDVTAAPARSARGQSLGDIQLAYGPVDGPVQRKARDGRDDLEAMMLHGPASEAPVQAKGAGGVRAAAGHGIAATATALPFGDQIQRSFGSHDVSGVQAHVGGQATEACDAMNAEAYATGNHVAFRGAPDLHTAAHEAAHVVQQRAGVHFAGGVGRQGDAYEQHADAVADQVVAGGSAEDLLSQMAPGSGAGDEAVQMRGKLGSGEEAFDAMWEAHPHNYQEDEGENTSSEDVREEHGLPDYMENTCAIRLSIMLNETGNKITPAKCAAAGLARKPHYSRKTKSYYILAAREMWQYLERHFRQEDVIFPAHGKYKDEEEFQAAFESTIKPLVQSRKGIAAFDKIFGYGGTGHIDLFDGETLSDAAGWYACQRLRLWFVVVP